MKALAVHDERQLIPLQSTTVAGRTIETFDARELWEFLGVRTRFNDWITRRIDEYGFRENVDYACYSSVSSGRGGNNAIEYHLTVTMGKELSMVEKTAKGKEARLYFIACEEAYKRTQQREAERTMRASERRATIEWQQSRADGKTFRRSETDTIKEFCEYAKSQGSKNFHRYYTTITLATYKALGFIEKSMPDAPIRELLDTIGLMNLAVAENLVSQTLKSGMAEGAHYKDIFQACKSKLEAFAGVVGTRKLLESPRREKRIGKRTA